MRMRAAAAIASLVAIAGLGVPARGEQTAVPWTFYGLNYSNTRFQQSDITKDNVSGMQQRWFYRTGRDVSATPIVVNDTVYVGDFGGTFYAFDAATGAVRWSRLLNGPIIDTAVFDGGRIFVGDNLRTFWALDAASGAVLWSTTPDVPEDIKPYLQFWGSPVPFEDRILVGISAEDKEISVTLDRKTWRGGVVALSKADGHTIWHTTVVPERCTPDQPPDIKCNGGSVWTTPAIDPVRRVAYWGTGNAYDPPAAPLTDSMIAVAIDTGQILWSYSPTPGDYWSYGVNICCNPDVDFGSSPVLYEIDGRPVVGEAQKNGDFHVLDRDTGALIWRKHLAGGRAGSSGGGFLSSPAYAYGKIFIGATDDIVDTPANAMSSHQSFTGSDGTQQWERLSPAWLWSAAAVTNEIVFQGTSLGTMVALDTATGAELWSSLPLGAIISSGPAIVGDAVYFGIGCCGTGGDTYGVHAFGLEGK